MQAALYQLFLIYHHVVAQIIKTKLVIGDICNITRIRLSSVIARHII